MTVDGEHLPADVPSGEDVTISAAQLRMVQDRLQRFMLEYEFGLREIETKIYILRDEFQHMHDYNPIEHVSTRVKSADSILRKVARKGVAPPGAMPDLPAVREHILDIAGVRVTCSFVRDAYRLFDLLTRQDDIRIREVKDYIAEPKANGYKSLHAIVDVPVFLSTGTLAIQVEVQFRTIAARKEATPAQIALAWLLAQQPWIVPIPGTRRLERLDENLGSTELQLSDEDLAELTEASGSATVTGDRYPEAMQRMIDR
jgi:putative GTP pyrophosphokinase